MTERDQWYTVEEAADILKVHKDTLRRWLREGKLRARKVGKGWRVPRSEVMPPDVEPSQ